MKNLKIIKNIYIIEPIGILEKNIIKKYLNKNFIKFFEFKNYIVLNKSTFNWKKLESLFYDKYKKIIIENFMTLDTMDGMGNPVAPTSTTYGSGDNFSYVVGSSYNILKKKRKRKKKKNR